MRPVILSTQFDSVCLALNLAVRFLCVISTEPHKEVENVYWPVGLSVCACVCVPIVTSRCSATFNRNTNAGFLLMKSAFFLPLTTKLTVFDISFLYWISLLT